MTFLFDFRFGEGLSPASVLEFTTMISTDTIAASLAGNRVAGTATAGASAETRRRSSERNNRLALRK